MGVQDSYVTVGREAVYGTPAALTRSFEAQGDGHKRQVEYLESSGMRPGLQATRSDRRRPVTMGAEGEIELDVLDKGFGMLLRAMMGASVDAVAPGAMVAHRQTHNSDADGPAGESLTVQYARAPITGAVIPKTYHGGKITEWELAQEVGELLKLTLTLDYEDEDAATAAAVATYPAASAAYGWPDCVVTVDGAPVDDLEISVEANNGLKTDRRYLRGSTLKKEPLRTEKPTYEGKLSLDYESDAFYNRFVAGSIHSIVATWTGTGVIEAGFPPFFKVTIPAAQFTGETPEVSVDDTPTQAAPFVALWNGAAPVLTVEYQTADTGF